MRQAVAYIRVSTEEQARQGYSIEAQGQVLRDYATGHEIHIVREFVESESAYKPGRQGFREMLTFLKRHQDVRAVLCYKIDRISRNLQDYSTLTELLGIEIVSATESLPSGATGEFVGGVQAVAARYYSAQLSERVSLGLKTKASKGLWPTYAPSGYNNAGDGIEPDETAAPLIGELFERFAAGGMSIDTATAWAKARGLRSRYGHSLARSAVHGILTNPIYYGALPWKGKLYEGVHTPLTTRETFERVQEQLRDRSPKRTNQAFPYRGLLSCGYCGCKITAERKKGRYVYYRCTYGRGRDCPQPYHREEEVSERFAGVVERIALSEKIAQKIMEVARQEISHWEADRAERLKRLTREVDRLATLRDDAYEDKLRGRIGEERWVRIDSRLGRQADELAAERRELVATAAFPLENVEAALELLKRAPRLYHERSHADRARLLQTLVSNSVLTAETLVPNYNEPFAAVAEGLVSEDWLGEEDSNPH